MKTNNKTTMVLGGFFLVLFVFSGYWLLIGRKATVNNRNEQVVPTDAVIPTIDSSVKISLTPLTGKKEVMLSIKNMPKNTNSLEYILSYETVEGGLQGVNSMAKITGSDFEKKITLGTCSSGTCVYHNIKDKIKIELVFKGDNEDKYFTKEYEL
ncbi:MAG: hypothetical protein UR54_C0004G0003 [Candidatus Roizmanbacteria bacterium GW2011_GWA2_34_18]|uniref:Uncharacterized protein n=1 Tax=Candidatus Roizmanbacteria bacterium GW2011_GWA2_34_18 TaxID=1618477 RepID=A0A0G0AW06_9BACT|nr:MAG: hypothetical protein UR54_C0004G0003 [Candidatus Roizmanbacteria bacterium GW2011_GWA2_34_18]